MAQLTSKDYQRIAATLQGQSNDPLTLELFVKACKGVLGVEVTRDEFRYYCRYQGTQDQRAGLSKGVLGAWSGRKGASQNMAYNHQRVRE